MVRVMVVVPRSWSAVTRQCDELAVVTDILMYRFPDKYVRDEAGYLALAAVFRLVWNMDSRQSARHVITTEYSDFGVVCGLDGQCIDYLVQHLGGLVHFRMSNVHNGSNAFCISASNFDQHVSTALTQ